MIGCSGEREREGWLHTLFSIGNLLTGSTAEKVGDWRVHIGPLDL